MKKTPTAGTKVNSAFPLQIAIDGPVGAGKSEIATRLSKRLHLLYIYTGAMYRAFALVCLREGKTDKHNKKDILPLLKTFSVQLEKPDSDTYPVRVLMNGQDITKDIFTPRIDALSSDVSTIPEVRAYMVKLQQTLAGGKRVVMEGRDIGFRVLPDAQLKIYLTASVRERAKRRYTQWVQKGLTHTSLEDAIRETQSRDHQDTHREVDPLQKLPDAWELDTTGMSKKAVVDAILSELRRRKLI